MLSTAMWYFLMFLLIDYEHCQAVFVFSPDYQFEALDLNISDEDFEGVENINQSISYGLWSKYNPLSSILQVGNIGIFDSNCFHYINAADKVTKRINMIYYDCIDYEKRTITKKVEIIDDQNQLHVFEMEILNDEYENVWFAFFMICWPQVNTFKILLMNQKGKVVYNELSIKYPFYDKNLTITFGGGLEVFYNKFQAYYNNSIIKYSYFPGTINQYWFQQFIVDYYSSEEYDFWVDYMFETTYDECENNEITNIIKDQNFSQGDKLIYNSKNPNLDYFQLIGWIRIVQVINPKSDSNYKIIKINVNSIDNRLTMDDLSAFQLYYKISNLGNSIIFTTYSYTFPTVNFNFINERFLITSEFKLFHNIEDWHFLSVTLWEKSLTVSIEFFEGITSQVYTKTIQVKQFTIVNFQLQFGNILGPTDSYLNIEMAIVQFSNCPSIKSLQKCLDKDCSICTGPTIQDCQSCFEDTKKVYIQATKQCVCALDTMVYKGECLNMKDFEFSIVEQKSDEQFQCPYGYFTVNTECFLCPTIISDSSITCLECLTNPLTWHTILYCSSQLVSYNGYSYTSETFNKMYFVFDGVDLAYCKYCTLVCTQDCINTHFQIVQTQDGVKCSAISAFNDENCFQCDLLYCQTCGFSFSKGKHCLICFYPFKIINGQCDGEIQAGVPEFCFDNCAYCLNKKCESCYSPYYLSFDRKSCKKCPIQNCKYCFEYKSNDININTIFKDFEPFEIDEYFSIGCSLCYDGFNYDFTSKTCIKGFPKTKNCIRSYIDLSGEEKCLLSAIDDFSIAPEIINCEGHITNCEQCVMTPAKKLKCIICKSGYSSQADTGLCDVCVVRFSKVCISKDYLLQDYWVQLIQSFIIQFFSNTYYYPQPLSYLQYDYPISCIDGYGPTREGQCVQYCDSQCLTCVENKVINHVEFFCKECQKTLYGFSRLSNDGNNCLECPLYCISCKIRSDQEIKKLNPYFVVTSANKIYTQICLRAFTDQRIKLDQETQIAYYCLDQKCSRSIEHYIHQEYPMSILTIADEINIDFCNQMGIKYLYLTLNFVDFQWNHLPHILANPFKQLIFSLQTTILTLKGQELNILQGYLNFTDFDIIIFQEMICLISLGDDQFYFQNTNNSISLYIKNTQFFSESNSLTNFQINVPLFKDLNISYLTFYEMNLENVIWIDYLSNLDEDIIEIAYLRIENCTFENTTLFQFQKYSKSIYFLEIEILNTYFSDSTFFKFNFINVNTEISNIFINNIKISNCTFKFSTFILNGGNQNMKIDQIDIYQNSFKNSVFINSNFQTTLKNVGIKDNEFLNSTFFQSTTQSVLGLYIDFLFKQFAITQNVFIKSKLFYIYQQNENKVLVNGDGFIQDDQLLGQIQFEIENLSSIFYLYDFSCSQLYLNDFTFQNTQNYSFFKVYQTDKIILSHMLFSKQGQMNKISASSACNLATITSPSLLYIFGFAEINIKNISVFNQFSIDNSLIEIQSDLQLKSTNTEIIRIEEITFRSNILLKYNLANLFSLLVIYSQRIQNIYMKDLNFIENCYHQMIDDPSQVSAGLFYLNSLQSSVELEVITCQNNSMTNSSYSFIALNSLTISFNQLTVDNHNLLNKGIWQKYYEIELDDTYTNSAVNYLIDQYFGIKTIGGVLQVVSAQLKIKNAYFSNILAYSSVALAITTQGNGIIEIIDVKIQRASVMLLQTNSINGCITISSVTSLLDLLLKNINFDSVQNRFGSAILSIDPSLKQNQIILMNITINNSFSLLNQIMKIQFSISSYDNNQVIIKDLNFLQSQEEFNQYLQNIIFPTTTEVRKIKAENSIINLQSCTIIIQNLQLAGILISPILIVNDAQKIIINSLMVQQVSVLYSFRLLSFSFTQTYVKNFIVENLAFHQTSEVVVTEQLTTTEIPEKIWFSDEINQCILIPQILKTEQINQTINSFIENLNQVSDNQGSLIYIKGLTQFSKLEFRQINIRNNNCSFCYEGLIQINQLIPARIKVNQLLCYQNFIIKYGCLSLLTEQAFESFKQYYILTNSNFAYNFGQMGVGTFVSNTPFKIKNNLFLRNIGSEKGGAILVLNMIFQYSINNTIILENSANFGGGIYLDGANFLSKTNFVQSLILFNQAQIRSDNLVEAPDHLILFINNEEMNSIIQTDGTSQQLYLKPYKLIEQGKIIMTNYLFLPSNYKLSNYSRFNEKKQIMESYISQFSLVYKNSLNEILGGEVKDDCQLFTREASVSSQEKHQNYTFIQDFSFQIDKDYFDLSSITLNFDPYQIQDKFIQLQFICQTTSGQKQLHYQINARTFKCQLGEFYTNNGCQYCEPNYGFYSVEYDVVKCSIFDVNKLDNITSNQLKLKIGYWRPNYFSNQIEYCFKGQKYCIGGWKVSNELCQEGHIGGLCEECDSFNVRGDGNYVKMSNRACGSCTNGSTFLPFLFILLWQSDYFYSQVFSYHLVHFKKYQKNKQNLCHFKNYNTVIRNSIQICIEYEYKFKLDFESIFLKMLLNYLWLFSVIFAFNMAFSLSAIDSISNPNVSMATNLDCQLITFGTLQLIYLRIITMIFFLLFQILIILVGFNVHFYLEKAQFDYSVISNLLIYLYVSNQAQLIKRLFTQFNISFASLIAIRTISGIDYIQGDVSLLFYEQDHITWIYVMILPGLIITGLIFPLFFLIILIFNRNKFNQSNFRKHFGYLFNEYNQEYSYWEQLKILQRSIIIIIITYFETDIYIKASLMSLTLIAYIIFAVSMKPYILKSLNKLDFQSCCIILISIFLGIVEYISSQQNSNSYLSMILQMIMFFLCLRICYCFISRIVALYYQKYRLQFLFLLKNLAYSFLTKKIYLFLNQHYSRILLKKQKLNKYYEKLREWKKSQQRYSIESKKQTTLTGFFNLSITKDRHQARLSFVPRMLMK